MKKVFIFLFCILVNYVNAKNYDSYEIEYSYDDKFFIINDEKFEAETYCFDMDKGDEVIFLEGDAYGRCKWATILNLRTKESCDVWCE